MKANEFTSMSKEQLTEKVKTLYAAKEEEYGAEVMRELERVVLLKVVDTKWMAHIDDMNELKKVFGMVQTGLIYFGV